MITNGLPMAALILLYKFRFDMTGYIILSWVLLILINTLLLHKVWPLLKMNLFLTFTSAVGMYVNNQIYYSFVYLDTTAKNAVWFEVTDTLGLLLLLTFFSILLRIALIYLKRYLRRLKDKKYRIIKIGEDAIYELLYEHFIENCEKYCNITRDDMVYGFSIDWENKNFIFAIKEAVDSGDKFSLDLKKLHSALPDTTKSIFGDVIYKDYYEKELKHMK